MAGAAKAAEQFKLTSIKQLGIQVVVESDPDLWCQDHIKLKFIAMEEESLTDLSQMVLLTETVAKLLYKTCPEIKTVKANGNVFLSEETTFSLQLPMKRILAKQPVPAAVVVPAGSPAPSN
ncbi:hypothetical protein PsAD2_03932 [Pseudovibrio axinellae]|uniref:Uncharacterized protein n=1 Tax=Pseudovibrio axinellae TaxID=989403 RepID=A0A165UNU2_9HYPH|nr:hypothetical protein [Pseudovibrio axinellae]KZL12626.1 hypothetical protein PsAD2_03932 [Pseudovibrio axinellae]SEP63922.1 hypothetical protein SAMN05421798_10148 [Pseudovibrio axinellae]